MELMRWKQAFCDGSLPHAVLIAGVEGSGKKAFARRAAAWFLRCGDDTAALDACPMFLTTDSTAAEDVRLLAGELMAETFQRGRRCLYLPDAHRLNEQAQNALLRTIEEPPADALVLLTGNETGLLPTIRSRCMILRTGAEEERAVAARLTEGGISPADAARAAHRAGGVSGTASRYAAAEFAAFADAAEALLCRVTAGDPAYADAARLITRKEAGEDGKKKARVSAELLSDLLDVFLGCLTDALRRCTGMGEAGATGDKIAAGFTLGQIQGMINVVLEAKRLMTFRAAPQQALDGVLAGLAGVSNQQNRI